MSTLEGIHVIGTDYLPYRPEICALCLVFTVIACSYIIFVAFYNTPAAMIRYRSHIIDSLLSCSLFSLTHMIWFSPYIVEDETQVEIRIISTSFVTMVFPDISLRFQMLIYTYVVVNAIRSTIFCFKYRFEIVVNGPLRKYYLLVRHYIIVGMLIYAVPCFYLVSYYSSEPIEQLGTFTFITSASSVRSISVYPNRAIFSVLYIAPLMFIAVLYVAAFIFLIVATHWLLYSSKTVAKQQSKKTLLAQKQALSMLMIQSLCTLGAGLIPCGFIFLVATIRIPFIVLLFNISTALVLIPYGFLYPCVLFLTTRPYFDFTIKLLLRNFGIVSLQSLRTEPTSTVGSYAARQNVQRSFVNI